MAYVESGNLYEVELVGGYCLPDNMLPGLLEIGSYRVDSQSRRYYLDTSYALSWPNGVIMDFLHDTNNINKDLVAIRWKGTDDHIYYMSLSSAGEYVLKVYIEDRTPGDTMQLVNQSINVQDTLTSIMNHTGPGEHHYKGRVQIQVCRDDYQIPYAGSMGVFLYDASYSGSNPEAEFHANAGQAYLANFSADSNSTGAFKRLYYAFQGMHIEVDNPTPSEPTENQNPEIEYRDDQIDFPDLPTDTVLATDFIRLYHLDNAGLSALASDLWDNNFYSNILKNYDSPFENIISLNILPVAVTGTSSLVIIGNYETSVSGEAIATQFVDLDGGSCRIDRLRDNQLDFEPARTLSIYIPFIGYRQVDLDDLTGGTAYLRYRIDLLTGNLLAMLRIVLDRNASGRYSHDSVEYFFNGNCATSIPVSGSNYATQYANMLNGAMSCTSSILSGGVTGAVGGASSIMNSKPTYQRSGSLSGNVGFMGNMTAFFLLSSPLPHIPENARQLMGYRSMIYRSFENLTGFEQIEKHYASAALAKECTKEELDEIERLLKEGVIF